jgi:hypothetical protein
MVPRKFTFEQIRKLEVHKVIVTLFASIVLLLSTVILASIRPARDDWNNWSNLRALSVNEPSSFLSIVRNSWCCGHEKRTFFLSWLIQWPITNLGSFTPFVMYIVILLLCIWIAKNLVYLVQFFTSDATLSSFTALIFVFSPFVVIVAFWPNNLFFLLPLAFSIELFRQLSSVRPKKLLISLLVFLTLFSGESAVIVLYSLLFYSFFLHRNGKFRVFLIMLTISSIAILLFYREFIVAGPKESSVLFSLETLDQYMTGFTNQFQSIIDYRSSIYKLDNLNAGRFFLVFFCEIIISYLFIRLSRIRQVTTYVLLRKGLASILVPGLLYLASLMPLVIGASLGIRTGSDYRYHLVPAFFLLLLFLIAMNSLLPILPRVRDVLLSILLTYSIFLSSLAFETRFQQGELDREIWQKVFMLESHPPEFVVTFNPHTPYVMPPYFSFAESDFQADWGVAGYLLWSNFDRPQVFKDLSCTATRCESIGYYGDKIEYPRSILDKTVFIASAKEIEPDSLDIGDFLITSNYSDFERFVRTNPRK